METSLLDPLPMLAASNQTCQASARRSELSFGSIGQGKITHNVRVLFVNGIRYSRSDCEHAAYKISQIANAQINYIYSDLGLLDGWFVTRNIQKSGKKASVYIKELLAANPDDMILAVTHSAGGLVFQQASLQLSDEEKKRISVVTFGSTYAFSVRNGFAHALNFVSRADILSHLSRIRGTGGTVMPLSGSWFPLREHTFLGPTYQTALTQMFSWFPTKGLSGVQKEKNVPSRLCRKYVWIRLPRRLQWSCLRKSLKNLVLMFLFKQEFHVRASVHC